MKNDLKVTLIDNSNESLERAQRNRDKFFKSKSKSSKTSSSVDFERKLSLNFNSSTNLNEITNCDIVIEAIPEILELKQKTFQNIEQLVNEQCILASNTSALSIADISKFLSESSKRRFIGLHYFSPVEKMKLVEIIKTPFTDEKTISKCFNLTLKQGKIPIVVNDSPGFYTTRVLMSIMSESLRLLQVILK